MKQCIRCGETKEEEQFYWRKKPTGESYRCKVCKTCKNKDENNRKKQSLPSYLKNSMRSRRWSAKNRGHEFSLDEDYILALFELQKGICPYTGVRFDYTRSKNMNSKEAISLDRWDCSKGYVKGNVMYISGRANVIKNNQSLEEFKKWMPSWFKRGLKLMEKINNELT